MNWYVAKIIFKITSGEGRHIAQYDEQLRLICADDDREAFAKAHQLGLKCQDRFINNVNEPVRWELVDVAELNLLPELTDGAELYYQIREAENPGLYEAWAHHKSTLLGITTH